MSALRRTPLSVQQMQLHEVTTVLQQPADLMSEKMENRNCSGCRFKDLPISPCRAAASSPLSCYV
jgi:hypothetical protein